MTGSLLLMRARARGSLGMSKPENPKRTEKKKEKKGEEKGRKEGQGHKHEIYLLRREAGPFWSTRKLEYSQGKGRKERKRKKAVKHKVRYGIYV